MAKRKSTAGRRAGLFIGGVMFGLVRGIFFKNKYWGVVMSFLKVNQIDKVWANICKYEGETFFTVRKIEYTYVVNGNCIFINNDSRRKITRDAIKKALYIEDPKPSKIQKENIWGPSYVCGIITDSRIVK